MTKLSVNVNKIATLRNARGGNMPNLISVVKDIESFGAQGITIHPRPDERHITYADTYELKKIIQTEYNIEGNPIPKFINMVLEIKPNQVTLVPDDINAITSNFGWDTIKHEQKLTEIVSEFKKNNIRTSIFVDPQEKMIEGAAKIGTDRIELYTEAFAKSYENKNLSGIKPYIICAELANSYQLEINAGHDLNLNNISFFSKKIPHLLEVSIGHALICESLYLGLENVINMYLNKLK